MVEKSLEVVVFVLVNLVVPVLVGLTLYCSCDRDTMRYCLAFAIILACYHFMTALSRLPRYDSRKP